MSTHEDSCFPPAVRDLPTAPRFVYRELQLADRPLDYNELRTLTGLSPRGVRKAITRLESADRVERVQLPWDPRQRAVRLVASD